MRRDKTLVAYLVRPAEGGIKSHVLTLMSGLDSSRFEPVLICTPECSLYYEAKRAGHRVIALDLIGDISPAYDLATAYELRGILRKLKPDILHIHSSKAGLVGRMAVMGILRRPKVVLTVHSFVFDERTNKHRRRLTGWIERRLAPFADRIIAVSNALRDELIAEMRLPARKIGVIYNGITFRDLPRPEHSDIRIGTISRLAPQKGVEHLLRAAAIVRGKHQLARFVIIGDGPFRYWLELTADELGIREIVDFKGFRSDALSLAAGFDIFALTSMKETFGLSLVEAMSQGIPVVASNTGGIPEIVHDGSTGLLAEPGNPEDIAEKICRLIEDKELAVRLGQQGCEYVRSTFSAERMLDETQELYTELITKK